MTVLVYITLLILKLKKIHQIIPCPFFCLVLMRCKQIRNSELRIEELVYIVFKMIDVYIFLIEISLHIVYLKLFLLEMTGNAIVEVDQTYTFIYVHTHGWSPLDLRQGIAVGVRHHKLSAKVEFTHSSYFYFPVGIYNFFNEIKTRCRIL